MEKTTFSATRTTRVRERFADGVPTAGAVSCGSAMLGPLPDVSGNLPETTGQVVDVSTSPPHRKDPGAHVVRAVGRLALGLPASLLRPMLGPVARSDRGVELDASTAALIALAGRLSFPPWNEGTPEQARAAMERDFALLAAPAEPMESVEDRSVPAPAGAMSARVYRPRTAEERPPVLVFFHGGGFVIGSIATHDGVCRTIARYARCIVVSIEYRLAPEHPYPAAVDDAEAGFLFVLGHADELGGDAARVAVGGDSAGGNLAAVVSRRLRDGGGPVPFAQILIYAATNLTRSEASHEVFSSGLLLDRELTDWFMDHYAADARSPDASPLFADDLCGLPPAVVATAGFDPLRDEGERYAQRLREAGVPVVELHEASLTHGFVSFAGASPAARRALLAIARETGRSLHR